MKLAPNDRKFIGKIFQFQKNMGGIFTTASLFNLIEKQEPRSATRAIERLVQDKILIRVQRGLYITKEFDLWRLSSLIQPESYLSLVTVLADQGLIGTTPVKRVYCVTLGKKKTIEILDCRLDYYTIKKELFFGFKKSNFGVQVADNEKSFLDLLYFYNRGYRFPIDPIVEVNLDRLNKEKIKFYLKNYQNPKFVKFVLGVLYG